MSYYLLQHLASLAPASVEAGQYQYHSKPDTNNNSPPPSDTGSDSPLLPSLATTNTSIPSDADPTLVATIPGGGLIGADYLGTPRFSTPDFDHPPPPQPSEFAAWFDSPRTTFYSTSDRPAEDREEYKSTELFFLASDTLPTITVPVVRSPLGRSTASAGPNARVKPPPTPELPQPAPHSISVPAERGPLGRSTTSAGPNARVKPPPTPDLPQPAPHSISVPVERGPLGRSTTSAGPNARVRPPPTPELPQPAPHSISVPVERSPFGHSTTSAGPNARVKPPPTPELPQPAPHSISVPAERSPFGRSTTSAGPNAKVKPPPTPDLPQPAPHSISVPVERSPFGRSTTSAGPNARVKPPPSPELPQPAPHFSQVELEELKQALAYHEARLGIVPPSVVPDASLSHATTSFAGVLDTSPVYPNAPSSRIVASVGPSASTTSVSNNIVTNLPSFDDTNGMTSPRTLGSQGVVDGHQNEAPREREVLDSLLSVARKLLENAINRQALPRQASADAHDIRPAPPLQASTATRDIRQGLPVQASTALPHQASTTAHDIRQALPRHARPDAHDIRQALPRHASTDTHDIRPALPRHARPDAHDIRQASTSVPDIHQALPRHASTDAHDIGPALPLQAPTSARDIRQAPPHQALTNPYAMTHRHRSRQHPAMSGTSLGERKTSGAEFPTDQGACMMGQIPWSGIHEAPCLPSTSSHEITRYPPANAHSPAPRIKREASDIDSLGSLGPSPAKRWCEEIASMLHYPPGPSHEMHPLPSPNSYGAPSGSLVNFYGMHHYPSADTYTSMPSNSGGKRKAYDSDSLDPERDQKRQRTEAPPPMQANEASGSQSLPISSRHEHPEPEASTSSASQVQFDGNNRLACPKCDKLFSATGNFRRHSLHSCKGRNGHVANTYQCPTCHKHFSRKDSLKRHCDQSKGKCPCPVPSLRRANNTNPVNIDSLTPLSPSDLHHDFDL